MVVESELLQNIGKVKNYLASSDYIPLFLQADTYTLLKLFPENSIDCVITSPAYWGQRAYVNRGIGLESTWSDYINNLLAIFCEIKRILKPSGSFWLNIGDSYQRKSLVGIPWRIALAMTDKQKPLNHIGFTYPQFPQLQLDIFPLSTAVVIFLI